MTDLLTRLESGSGSDRELDALIEAEARRHEAYRAGIGDKRRAKWMPVGNTGDVEEGGTRYASLPVTSSLDAAISLLGRMLPGWSWSVAKEADECMANVVPSEQPYDATRDISAFNKSAPRALLIALLRALDQEPQTKETSDAE